MLKMCLAHGSSKDSHLYSCVSLLGLSLHWLYDMHARQGKSSSVQRKGNSLQNHSGQTETCLTKLEFLIRVATSLCSHYTFSQSIWHREQTLSWAVLDQQNIIGGCKIWFVIGKRDHWHSDQALSGFLQDWDLVIRYSCITGFLFWCCLMWNNVTVLLKQAEERKMDWRLG